MRRRLCSNSDAKGEKKMTVTLELPPDMEAALSAKAELYDLTLSDYLFSLLEADMDEGYSMTVEEIAIVKERLAEVEAGDKGILLEDYWAEVMAKREVRSGQQAPQQIA
jgi:hypothetical protein